MKPFPLPAMFLILVFANLAWGQGNQTPNNPGEEPTPTPTPVTCPAYLLAEFNNHLFYQLKDCSTGKLLDKPKRYFQKVKTGCKSATECECTEPTAPTTQTEYADPESRIFVPFGGGASSHLGPAKQLVEAGGKKFVIISMRLKGMASASADDNMLDVVVQFGQEVDPATSIPSGAPAATLSGNTLTVGGRDFEVTLKTP